MSENDKELTEATESLKTLHIAKRQDYLQWDDYFMATAILSAKRSKDPVTQVGACIVDKHNRIVAIGYNGFPRDCSDDIFPWTKNADDALENKKLYVVHAEANAILNSNSTSLVGTRLYTTLFPCNECTKLIIQSGIRSIFYISDKYAEKSVYQASKRMLNSVGISYRQHVPVKKQIVIDFDDILNE
ncbi:probable deoxycytidylate deaminase [Drosophila sulfurigaster albostrigata]|uniref:Probable deoxycytidylate deaminase n=1 Tax=Drosophila albomicans TaxID=7291 RepID=A0A6P8XEG1_DROAB|nr:probable deoxycytidylate deaminase [Drosophila albomicans]XP_060660019.1 probable deoxycytidylate deaminase [Drosophila nasuta]XP_062133706.1 probable deoxycytidylate deaminase [Drosophila sulfurigaster albostrigata]